MSLYGRVGAGIHARLHRKIQISLPIADLPIYLMQKQLYFRKSFANIEGMMEK